MRKKFLPVLLLPFLAISFCAEAKQEEPEFVEPVKMRVTCYISERPDAKTKDGSVPKEWMCAGRKEDLGKIAILYRVKEDGSIGDLIGYFEIRDTGSDKGLRNGTKLDIYRDSLERVKDWINEYGDYCFVQILDGKG